MADAATQGKKRGRKPANEEPANKKIALQRAAARAFRERKEKYVQDLEETVKSLSGVTEVNQQLRFQLEQLERENAALRQSLSFRSQSNLSNSDTSSPSPLITPQNTLLLHDTPTQPVNLPPISDFTFNMGVSHQSIPLQYDTFVDLRPNLDINPTVFSPELIALLNAPLPVEPTPSQIIRPHFERLRVGFFSLRCLANDGAIVAELFDRLLDYTAFCTRTLDVFICPPRWAKLQEVMTKIRETSIKYGSVDEQTRIEELMLEIKEQFIDVS